MAACPERKRAARGGLSAIHGIVPPGLLLRSMNSVARTRKPYNLLCTHSVVNLIW